MAVAGGCWMLSSDACFLVVSGSETESSTLMRHHQGLRLRGEAGCYVFHGLCWCWVRAAVLCGEGDTSSPCICGWWLLVVYWSNFVWHS
jgi:hypothetical protein